MVDKGCPEGMYPLDSSFEANVYDTFEELRSAAENASDILNLPLSWFFDEGEDGDYGPSFTIVFLMPRKYGQTWSMRTHSFDRPTVQAWLDTWLRGEIDRWFGWADQGKTRISDEMVEGYLTGANRPTGETHDEDTLTKVYEGLYRAGLSGVEAADAVNQMQNAGILFRERAPEPAATDEPTPINGKWVCGKCARAVARGYDDGQIPEHHRTCPKYVEPTPADDDDEGFLAGEMNG